MNWSRCTPLLQSTRSGLVAQSDTPFRFQLVTTIPQEKKCSIRSEIVQRQRGIEKNPATMPVTEIRSEAATTFRDSFPY